MKKHRKHIHQETVSKSNLIRRLNDINDFVHSVSPDGVICHVCDFGLTTKTPLMVTSDDSVAILHVCQGCGNMIVVSGSFEFGVWIASNMSDRQIEIMLDAAKAADEVSIFQMLLQFKLRKQAGKN